MANRDFLVRMKADTRNYDANLAKAKQQLTGFAKANLSAGGAMKQLSGSLVSMATRFASVTAGVGALGAAFKNNVQTALHFEKSMSQLSSLTGMVGNDLAKLKNYAIELGSSTTLTASEVADAFKMIGSQQPQLLQSGEALKSVTKQAITLSEAAGIDLATAAQTLSTSINQMGGDSNNAARYVNVLAAASQKGAGDISWLGESITKAATAAKAVGTDYEELVSILEQLAKAGFDASTAGTALRSIIMNLEKQSNSQFKPSVVGLTQAFENLGKAELDLTGYQNLVGKMFASQAKVLSEASGEAKKMKEEITGTNIAEEQAKTNTDNLSGSMKQLSSAWEGLNLHINSSNGFLKSCVDWLKNVVVQVDILLSREARVASFFKKLNGGESSDSGSLIGRYIRDLQNANPEDRESLYQRQMNALQKKYAEAVAKMQDAQSPNTRFKNFMTGGVRKWTKEIQDARAEVAAIERMMSDLRSAYKGIQDSGNAGANGSENVVKNLDANAESATKSIKELTAELKQLKAARDEAADAGNSALVEEYNQEIKSVQDQIKSMRGGTVSTVRGVVKELDPLQSIEKKIADLTKEALSADASRRDVIRSQISDLQSQAKALNDIKSYVTSADYKEGSLPALMKELKDLQEQQEQSANADEWKKWGVEIDKVTRKIGILKGEIKDLKPQSIADVVKEVMDSMSAKNTEIDKASIRNLIQDALTNGIDFGNMLDTYQMQIEAGIDVPDAAWQAIVDEYNDLREKIGKNKIKMNFETGEIEDAGKKGYTIEAFEKDQQNTQKVVSGLQSVSSGLQQMGIQLPEGVQKFLNGIQGATSIIQGVMSIIQVFQTASTSSQSLNTAALNANTATIGALISTLTMNSAISAIPFFAKGGVVRAANGIVPGQKWANDRVPALLNSGEVVLNRAQAGNLASQLSDGRGKMEDVRSPYVSGEQVFLAVNNYLRRKGRGELITAR